MVFHTSLRQISLKLFNPVLLVPDWYKHKQQNFLWYANVTMLGQFKSGIAAIYWTGVKGTQLLGRSAGNLIRIVIVFTERI